MSNLMQGTPFNEGEDVYEIGDRVRTVQVADPSTDWIASAHLTRRWGVEGVVTNKHDSHGTTYEVRHGATVGHYEPRELEPAAKEEWISIDSGTAKLKVPGGWIYRTRTYKNLTRYENFPEKDEYALTGETTVFVPDPVTTVP